MILTLQGYLLNCVGLVKTKRGSENCDPYTSQDIQIFAKAVQKKVLLDALRNTCNVVGQMYKLRSSILTILTAFQYGVHRTKQIKEMLLRL